MFPLPISVYVKIGILTIIFLSGLWLGYSHEHDKLVQYKERVSAEAKAQEIHIEQIQKQHELVTKGIEDEYNAKLALIRQYYANGVQHPNGSRPVSSLSTTTAISDAIANYNLLSSQCAETTIQLIELQKWLNEQVGIK